MKLSYLPIAVILLSSILGNSYVFAQNKEGFYDEYNMDLRNIPGGETESDSEERFRTYQIPPVNQKNHAVTPKNVKKYYDPLASIPGAGSGNLQSLGNQGSTERPPGQRQQSFINPITGEINYQAAQDSINNRDRDREKKEKDKKRFIEEKVYPESKLRRFQIVFFLTMPFALGASAAAASLLGIEKAITGSILMITGTTGLSATNAYKDVEKLDEHKKKHGSKWTEEENEELADTLSE